MTRGVVAISGAAGVVGVIGAVQLIEHGPKHASAWIWIAGGFAVLFLAQIWVVQRALEQREAALATTGTTQTFILAEGDVKGLTATGNVMTIGGHGDARHQRKRRFSRIITEEERKDLADRCEACGADILNWLYRPIQRGSVTTIDPSVRWQEERRQDDEHRLETQTGFEVQFAARARDLLNECVEAGYSIGARAEVFRVEGGSVNELGMRDIGEGIGIVGRSSPLF